MLRLGGTAWWLRLEPKGEAWQVLRVVGGKQPQTRAVGRFTSWRHALQVLERTPKASKVPKGAVAALRALVAWQEAGVDLLAELPGEPSESSGRDRDGRDRTDSPEDDDEDDE